MCCRVCVHNGAGNTSTASNQHSSQAEQQQRQQQNLHNGLRGIRSSSGLYLIYRRRRRLYIHLTASSFHLLPIPPPLNHFFECLSLSLSFRRTNCVPAYIYYRLYILHHTSYYIFVHRINISHQDTTSISISSSSRTDHHLYLVHKKKQPIGMALCPRNIHNNLLLLDHHIIIQRGLKFITL